MGSNKNLFILLGVAVVALVATLMSGGFNLSEEVDPAQALIAQQGGSSVAAPAPAAEAPPVQAKTPPPTAAAGEDSGDVDGGDTAVAEGENPCDVANPCAEGSTDSIDVSEDDGAEELIASTDENGSTDELAMSEGDDDIALDGLDGEAPADEDLFLEDEISDDPIERFKDMDPRDIIDAKYIDLEDRTTTPWDEEDGKNFIPMTGRPDPLTRIKDAIPDELMPPRAGGTDDSQIQLYAASIEATGIVNQVSNNMQCYNVLQIGLDKRASFMIMGRPYTMQEGSTQQFGFFVEGVRGNVVMMVTSISTDLVTVNFSAVADKVDLGISKTQSFIPSKGF